MWSRIVLKVTYYFKRSSNGVEYLNRLSGARYYNLCRTFLWFGSNFFSLVYLNAFYANLKYIYKMSDLNALKIFLMIKDNSEWVGSGEMIVWQATFRLSSSDRIKVLHIIKTRFIWPGDSVTRPFCPSSLNWTGSKERKYKK